MLGRDAGQSLLGNQRKPRRGRGRGVSGLSEACVCPAPSCPDPGAPAEIVQQTTYLEDRPHVHAAVRHGGRTASRPHGRPDQPHPRLPAAPRFSLPRSTTTASPTSDPRMGATPGSGMTATGEPSLPAPAHFNPGPQMSWEPLRHSPAATWSWGRAPL